MKNVTPTKCIKQLCHAIILTWIKISEGYYLFVGDGRQKDIQPSTRKVYLINWLMSKKKNRGNTYHVHFQCKCSYKAIINQNTHEANLKTMVSTMEVVRALLNPWQQIQFLILRYRNCRSKT